MIHCKIKCTICGEYTPCNGLQVHNMRYCPKCKKKYGVKNHENNYKNKTIIRKNDNKKMKEWQTPQA